MDSLSTGRVAQTLQRLFREAEQADRALMEQFTCAENPEQLIAETIARHFDEERRDIRGFYRGYVDNFLNVTPEYGRFLYQCARAREAKRIVEFGTSMGVSTLHLAAALRDSGGGRLIGTELEPGKAARARANLEAAGLADLVEIRIGDARDTLREIGGEVDLVARRCIQPLSAGTEAAGAASEVRRAHPGGKRLRSRQRVPRLRSQSCERLSLAADPDQRGPGQRIHRGDAMTAPPVSDIPAGRQARRLGGARRWTCMARTGRRPYLALKLRSGRLTQSRVNGQIAH